MFSLYINVCVLASLSVFLCNLHLGSGEINLLPGVSIAVRTGSQHLLLLSICFLLKASFLHVGKLSYRIMSIINELRRFSYHKVMLFPHRLQNFHAFHVHVSVMHVLHLHVACDGGSVLINIKYIVNSRCEIEILKVVF